MGVTTDRKASVSLSEHEVIDRLFHFFAKAVRNKIVSRRLNNGGLSFTFIDATDEVVRILEENFTEKEKQTPVKNKKKPIDHATLIKMKVSDLGFSVRTENCLRAVDVETVADLCKQNRKKLLQYRNFGHKSLEELEQFMKRNNLSWTDELTAH